MNIRPPRSRHACLPIEPGWTEIAPLLDEALASLGVAEREAVTLRFLVGRTQEETAATLGVASWRHCGYKGDCTVCPGRRVDLGLSVTLSTCLPHLPPPTWVVECVSSVLVLSLSSTITYCSATLYENVRDLQGGFPLSCPIRLVLVQWRQDYEALHRIYEGGKGFLRTSWRSA